MFISYRILSYPSGRGPAYSGPITLRPFLKCYSLNKTPPAVANTVQNTSTRPSNIVNESRIKACLSRFDSDLYNPLQFLRAVSHSVGAHTAALQSAIDSDSNDDDDEQSTASTATTSTAPYPAAAAADEPTDCCVVCLVAPREGFALVPRGHARFCESCANRVATLDCCPVCRANITVVIRIFM